VALPQGILFSCVQTIRGISKYFFFGGKRVSMRINEDGPIYHFGSDHLGSVSLAVSGGVVQAQSRFTPFGVERWKSLRGTNQPAFHKK